MIKIAFILIMTFAPAAYSENPYVESILSQMGPLVPNNKAPELYKFLGKALKKFEDARRAYITEKNWILLPSMMRDSKIYIFESVDPNAFVFDETTAADRDKYRDRSGLSKLIFKPTWPIFISTGLLRDLLLDSLNTNDVDEIKDALYTLMGVLAHEAAHPVEVAENPSKTHKETIKHLIFDEEFTPSSKRTILKWIEENFAKQDNEIRADTEGGQLSHIIGIPSESVYLALNKIVKNPHISFEDSYKVAISSHPEKQVRAVANRLTLTFRRMDQGERADNYQVDADVEKIRTELHSFKYPSKAKSPPVFQKFNSMEELLDFKKDPNVIYPSFLNNHLITTFYEFMKDYETFSPPIQERAKQTFSRLVMAWARGHVNSEVESKLSFPNVPRTSEWQDKFTSYPSATDRDIKEFNKVFFQTHAVPHYKLTGNIPYFLAFNTLQNCPFDLLGFLKHNGNDSFVDYIPTKVISDFLGQDNFIMTVSNNGLKRPFYNLPYLSNEIQENLTEAFWQDFNSKNTRERFDTFNSFQNRNRDKQSNSPDFLISTLSYSEGKNLKERRRSAKLLREYVATRINDPHFINSVNEIWLHRGELLTMSLEYYSGVGYSVAWDIIFQVLGLSLQEGKAQLTASVKEYTASVQYSELLDILVKMHPDYEVDKRTDYTFSQRIKRKIKFLQPDLTLFAFFEGKYLPSYSPVQKENVISQNYKFGGSSLFNEEAIQRFTRQPDSEPEAKRFVPWAAIDQSTLPNEVKKERLTEMLTKANNTSSNWTTESFSYRIYKILKKYDVVSGVSDIDIGWYYIPSKKLSKRYFDELVKNLYVTANSKQLTDQQKYANIIKIYNDSYRWRHHGFSNAYVGDARKVMAKLIENLNLTFVQYEEAFILLTKEGATKETDSYFLNKIAPHLLKNTDHQASFSVPPYLTENRFFGQKILLEVIRPYLILPFENSKNDKQELTNKILTTLINNIPSASMEKDQLLEDIAWKSGAQELATLEWIQKQKGYGNWNNTKPLIFNMASVFSYYFYDVKPELVDELIAYLLKADGGDLPEKVKKIIRRKMSKKNDKLAKAWINESHSESAVDAADKLIEFIKIKLRETSPQERIPLFDFLLHTGTSPLAVDHDKLVTTIADKYLNLAPGSKELLWLRAYLNSIPSHEVSVHLSYLLHKKLEGSNVEGSNEISGQVVGTSIKDYFEMFRTVGKKSGQLAVTFNLVSESHAVGLEDLKDRAKPMDKYDTVKIMSREMSPAQLASLTLVKPLNAASIKTVDLALTNDGQEVVVAVKNPHAKNQIATTLKFAQKFLSELQRMGVIQNTVFLSHLTQLFEETIYDELDYKKEVSWAKRIQRIADKFNADKKTMVNGWKIKVALPAKGYSVTKNIMVLTRAPGIPFNDITDVRVKNEAGEDYVRFWIRVFLTEGIFESDRHIKNQLIDVANHTITMFDLGQAFNVSKSRGIIGLDDRVIFLEFLQAFYRKDPKALIEIAKKMSPKTASPNPQGAVNALMHIFQTQTQPDQILLESIKGLVENGYTLNRKYLLGIIKGTLTLAAENYVDHSKFVEIIINEGQRFYTVVSPIHGLRKSIKTVGFHKTCMTLLRGQELN